MIALRAPLYLELGIATALTFGAYLAHPSPPQPTAPAPAFAPAPPADDDEALDIRTRSTERSCDADAISAIVIRGQFTSLAHQHPHEGFAISFAGTDGRYTAFTDPRGYFEVRMPREDFAGNLCELPASARSFRDDQMTLSYRLDFE